MQRIATALYCLFFFSVFAQSQEGIMTYVPATTSDPVAAATAAVHPVPIPVFFLIPLGLILAVVGVRAVMKNGGAIGAVVALTGALAVIGGMAQISEAVVEIIELSNPNGDTVQVPAGSQQYKNTSGVDLKVSGIVPPCDASNSASNACKAGETITPDGTCSTQYICEPVSCTPDCSGKVCGSDGCGGSCGSCAGGQQCTSDFLCVALEAEVCDGIDNDGDSEIDEDVIEPSDSCEVSNQFGTCGGSWQCSGASGWMCDAQPSMVYYRDGDGDGYGNDNDTISSCSAPAGYVVQGGDCNDGNGSINPGAQEVPDGLDNDCDGITDE